MKKQQRSAGLLNMGLLALGCLVAWAGPLAVAEGQDGPAALAKQILEATGIDGGLIVHVGCADGKLTAALRANPRCVVQGLDADPKNVEKARRHLQSLGIYGSAMIDQLRGKRLPYVDGLVNLVVSEDPGDLEPSEIMRVLCPGGVAYVKQGGKWTKTVKPWPNEIDEWTHYLHGSDNNAVAADSVAGEPRSLQWISEPRFGRSHEELASVSAAVTAGGRVFFIVDEAPFAFIRFLGQWRLVARDAFNGALLWKREIPQWNDHLRHFRSGPVQLQRRLVAVGDRVYATLGLAAPVTEICAATGKTLKTYQGTEHTEEIVVDGGVLFLVVGTSEGDRKGGGLYGRGEPKPTDFRYVTAIDAESGRTLWKHDFGDKEYLLPLTLAARDGSVYYQSTQGMARLDAKTGETVWKTPRATLAKRMGFSAPTLVVTKDVVLCADREPSAAKPETAPSAGKVAWGVHGWNEGGFSRLGPSKLRAYAVKDGKELWSVACSEGYNSPTDLFVVDGVAWVGSNFRGYDVATGELVRELPWKGARVAMPHHRCYRNKATEKYILTGRSGIEVVDIKKGWIGNNSWIRGTCQYGIMPANGLIYAPPSACACFNKVKTQGFCAAAAARADDGEADRSPLVKGPAFGKSAKQNGKRKGGDWPMYRSDNARSGSVATDVPDDLAQKWSAKIGGRLTQPVVAGGRVYVAAIDSHTVYALGAGDGKQLWSFIAGGRIDSSPTCYRGTILFGAADGWVYCLRADDGQLVWQFQAAPKTRLVGAFDQLSSMWPVHGSVLIQDDTLYVVAGRNSYLDGGLVLYRIDPATGEELSQTTIYHLDPKTGRQIGREPGGFDMEGVRSDLLSGDGRSIFLKHMRFDPDGQPMSETKPHLFSIDGFLGEEWFVRSYWIFGTNVSAGWSGWAKAAASAPAGRILAMDDGAIFGYGRTRVAGGPTGHKMDAYHLWRRDRTAAPTAKPPQPKPVPKKPAEPGKKTKRRRPAGPRLAAPVWSDPESLIVRAMVLTPETLLVAGPPDLGKKSSGLLAFDNADEALAGFLGQRGVQLRLISTKDGKKRAEYPLKSMPVFDGMSAAGGQAFIAQKDGTVVCWGKK